jgi:hypothetical protein
MALALLSLNQVKLSFDDIVEEATEYFRDHWIKKIQLSLWNMVDFDVCINNLSTRFYDDAIDRVELLDGLSLLVASKK